MGLERSPSHFAPLPWKRFISRVPPNITGGHVMMDNWLGIIEKVPGGYLYIYKA